MNTDRKTIITELAKTTTQEIVDYFETLNNNFLNTTDAYIENKIKELLNNAFKNIRSEEEYKQLNQMLLLKFHSDKVLSTFSQTLVEHFRAANKSNVINIPIQLLLLNHEHFNHNKTFNNFIRPSTSSKNTQAEFSPSQYNDILKKFAEEMKKHNEENKEAEKKNKQFWEERNKEKQREEDRDRDRVAKFKQQFDELTIDKYSDLPEELEEGGFQAYLYLLMLNTFIKINKVSEKYSNPWRFIARGLKLCADMTQFGINTFYFLLLSLPLLIISGITLLEDRLFKTLLGKDYKDSLARRGRYAWMLDVIMNEAAVRPEITGLSFITTPLSLLFSTPIAMVATIQADSLLDFRLLSKIFYQKLSTPLAKTNENRVKAILTKSAQLITGAVLFLIITPIELLKYALLGISQLVTITGFSLAIATRGVIALPGIVIQYFNTKKNLPNANQSKQPPGPTNSDSNTPESAQTPNKKTNPGPPPVHHKNPIHAEAPPKDTSKEHHNDQTHGKRTQ